MKEPHQYSQEELSQWVREQFQKANKHLAENGVLFESVITEESRYLAPFAAVWKIKATDGQIFWVISGDLPTDFMPVENETNARDALRHFSFTWQAKAENIRRTHSTDPSQVEHADVLQSRAEGLYRIYSQAHLWESVEQ